MIKEFALDPTLLLHWAKSSRDYHEFLREYGRGTPRLISSFPKKKFSKLRSYLLEKSDCLENETAKLRYIEMVQALAEGLVCRSCNTIETNDWHELVLSENQLVPFDTILTKSNINVSSAVSLDHMYDSQLWNLPSQVNLKRTQQDLLKNLDSFIKTTKDYLVFIDAFCYQNRAIDIIAKLINKLQDKKFKDSIPQVLIFYRENKNSKDVNYVKEKILTKLHPDLKIDLKVSELKPFIGQDTFHNRYILNDCGGILLPYGFDLSDEDCETDEAIILSRENYGKRWEQFVEKLSFEVVKQA